MINISRVDEDQHCNDFCKSPVLHMCESECEESGKKIPTAENNIDLCFNSAIHRNLFESELKEWEILLAVIKNDNGVLIVKLSLLVDDNCGKEFLSKAEYFQNEFITRDEYLQELEKEINEQELIIKSGKKLLTTFSRKHDKLRNEIYSFKKNYMILKTEFADYIKKK